MTEEKKSAEDLELSELQKRIEEKKANVVTLSSNIFSKPKNEVTVMPEKDTKSNLVNQAFDQAVVSSIETDDSLKDNMMATAKVFTRTKMQKIITDVDTEHKKAVFNNKKDACESYGFDEETTPIWATNLMAKGYNVVLAIWLFIGTFTFMPIIFISKKIQVGVKKTWLAILIAILLYLGITFLPILLTLIK